MTKPTDLPNGYYILSPGRLANAVTWLEMRAAPPAPLATPLRLRAVGPQDRDGYDTLFKAVGTPWLWSRAFARTRSSGDAHIALDDAGEPIGVVEFTGREESDVEIAYFGLLPAATGRGLGRRMMAAALDLAWIGAARVWLHTCSFDHPAALAFYRSCGFVATASGFELMDDPRIGRSGPGGDAPHVPRLTPGER